MEKISQLICFIVFVVLVAASSMGQNAVNQAGAGDRLGSECVTATINDSSCRADHCHNTTTHIHNCEDHTFNPDCANYTARIDTCNATFCKNTTRHIHVCAYDISNKCGNTDIKMDSCTNGVCRNRTSTIHACYNNANTASAAVCSGIADDDDVVVQAANYATCFDDLFTFLARVLGK